MQLSGQRLSEQLPQSHCARSTPCMVTRLCCCKRQLTPYAPPPENNGFSERHVFTVAGAHFDWGEVESAASAMSLFADKQLIDIRIPSGKPGKEGSEALQRIAARLVWAMTVSWCCYLYLVLDKTAKSSGWFTALDAHGISVQIEPVERAALPAWIAQRLALQQQRVRAGEEGQRSLQFFADQGGGQFAGCPPRNSKNGTAVPRAGTQFRRH